MLYVLFNTNQFLATYLHMENRMCRNNLTFMLILSGKWTHHGVSEMDIPMAKGGAHPGRPNGKMEKTALWVV